MDRVNCVDCVACLTGRRHPCLNHSACIYDDLWDPSNCEYCIDLFSLADSCQTPNEASNYLIRLAKRILSISSSVGPDNSIFVHQSAKIKFSRPWLLSFTVRSIPTSSGASDSGRMPSVSHTPSGSMGASEDPLALGSEIHAQGGFDLVEEVCPSIAVSPSESRTVRSALGTCMSVADSFLSVQEKEEMLCNSGLISLNDSSFLPESIISNAPKITSSGNLTVSEFIVNSENNLLTTPIRQSSVALHSHLDARNNHIPPYLPGSSGFPTSQSVKLGPRAHLPSPFRHQSPGIGSQLSVSNPLAAAPSLPLSAAVLPTQLPASYTVPSVLASSAPGFSGDPLAISGVPRISSGFPQVSSGLTQVRTSFQSNLAPLSFGSTYQPLTPQVIRPYLPVSQAYLGYRTPSRASLAPTCQAPPLASQAPPLANQAHMVTQTYPRFIRAVQLVSQGYCPTSQAFPPTCQSNSLISQSNPQVNQPLPTVSLNLPSTSQSNVGVNSYPLGLVSPQGAPGNSMNYSPVSSPEAVPDAAPVSFVPRHWSGLIPLTSVSEEMKLFLNGDDIPPLYGLSYNNVHVMPEGLVFGSDKFSSEEVFVGKLASKLYLAVKGRSLALAELIVKLSPVSFSGVVSIPIRNKISSFCRMAPQELDACTCQVVEDNLALSFNSLNLGELSNQKSKLLTKKISFSSKSQEDLPLFDFLQAPMLSSDSHKLVGSLQDNLTNPLTSNEKGEDFRFRQETFSLVTALGAVKELDRTLKFIKENALEESRSDPCLATLSGIDGLSLLAIENLEFLLSSSLAKLKESRESLREKSSSGIREQGLQKQLVKADIWSPSLFSAGAGDLVNKAIAGPVLRELKVSQPNKKVFPRGVQKTSSLKKKDTGSRKKENDLAILAAAMQNQLRYPQQTFSRGGFSGSGRGSGYGGFNRAPFPYQAGPSGSQGSFPPSGSSSRSRAPQQPSGAHHSYPNQRGRGRGRGSSANFRGGNRSRF